MAGLCCILLFLLSDNFAKEDNLIRSLHATFMNTLFLSCPPSSEILLFLKVSFGKKITFRHADQHFPSLWWLCECTSWQNLAPLKGNMFGEAIMLSFLGKLFFSFFLITFFPLISHSSTSTLKSIVTFAYLSVHTWNNVNNVWFIFFLKKACIIMIDSSDKKYYTNEADILWEEAR